MRARGTATYSVFVSLAVTSVMLVPVMNAAGAPIPPGSYQQSCRDIAVVGNNLSAACRTRSGSWQYTTLFNYRECVGDIGNDNGALRCNRPPIPLPAGSYQQSCRDIAVVGKDLSATCRTRSGSWQYTTLFNYRECVGDIGNDNGTLSCNRSGSASPGGSYRQSCSDISVGGTTLYASCRTRTGSLHATQLANFAQCTGDIVNYDGDLRCSRGGTPVPSGSYTRSCRDVWIDNGTLYATCQMRSGSWRASSLSNVGTCRTAIGNLDGWLTCDRGTGPAPQGSYRQTCFDVLVNGDSLSATCEVGGGSGGTVNRTTLQGVSACRTAIGNIYGYLTCDRGTGSAPGGSYKSTCRDITVNGAALNAVCRTRSGGWNTAALNGPFSGCGDISNDDGRLRCMPPARASHPATPPQQPAQQQGVGTVAVYNCNVNSNANGVHNPIHVWVYDFGTSGWDDKGELAAQYGGAGNCPVGAPTTVSLDDGHLYLIVGVDPQLSACGGNEPTQAACQRITVYVLGKKGGSTYPLIVP